MKRGGSRSGWGVLFWLCACGSEPTPPSTQAAPAAAPSPVKPATPSAVPGAPNPCSAPAPITLELSAGEIKQTPWGLDIVYAIDEDEKRGPGYMFMLRSGSRRWETRRDDSNWTKLLTWRGFCWRGDGHPERRASHVQIDIAPVCKDGQLQELGGCGTTLGN
jgi:hypothetical protein